MMESQIIKNTRGVEIYSTFYILIMNQKLKKCYVITDEGNDKAFIINEGKSHTRVSNGIEEYEVLNTKIIKI